MIKKMYLQENRIETSNKPNNYSLFKCLNMPDRDRDFQPEEGQQSNQNWDDQNDQSKSRETKPDAENTDRRTNTSGAGSSQRRKDDNVGPLDSDLSQLPSEKRRDRKDISGSGID
jgi:hypothetical protein